MMRIIVNHSYTYETDLDVKTGDRVILPTPNWLVDVKGRTWEGEVTSIGSDYQGFCEKVKGIVGKSDSVKNESPAMEACSALSMIHGMLIDFQSKFAKLDEKTIAECFRIGARSSIREIVNLSLQIRTK